MVREERGAKWRDIPLLREKRERKVRRAGLREISFIGNLRRCNATVKRRSKKCDFANFRYQVPTPVDPGAPRSRMRKRPRQPVNNVVGFKTIDHDRVIHNLCMKLRSGRIYPYLLFLLAQRCEAQRLKWLQMNKRAPQKGVSVSNPNSRDKDKWKKND